MNYVEGCARLWPTAIVTGLVAMAAVGSMAYLGPVTAESIGPPIIGGMSLVLSCLIWSLRPKELATQLFALNGMTFAASLFCIGAIEAVGEGAAIRPALLSGNLIANHAFYLTLIALFLSYPVRLVGTAWIWAVAGLALPLGAAAVIHSRFDAFYRWLALTELVAILVLIVVQGVRTHRKPRERAALMWLALSVAVGTALWCGLLVAELMGVKGLTTGVIPLILFFPFYVGLAMGVARFCLVELQDWTFRILFYVVAALLFIAVDAALVFALNMGGAGAIGISLLLVAFAYLPLREVVWRRLVQGRTLTPSEMFAHVLEIVFAPTPMTRRNRWEGLLQGLFRPLSITAAEETPDAAIADDGLTLRVPAVADAPAFMLSMAREGRGLFSPSQLALVRQMVALVRTAAHSRDAYERGAAEERRRLAQDLHDDVGARLLSGLQTADDRTRPLLYDALGDIRAIAGGLMGTAAPLDRVLADIRAEGMRRLEAGGCDVVWTLWPDNAPLVLVGYRVQKALASAVRETVSNVLKHARAGRVEVTVALDGDRLRIRIDDDGVGFAEAALNGEGGGMGLGGLSQRLAGAGGAVRFSNRTQGGAEVAFEVPLA